MDILQIPPVEPLGPSSAGDSQWRPILLGTLAAMVVSGTLVTVVAGIGTTVAQLTTVMATANADSATRHAQAYAQTSCGLASR